MEIFDDVRKDAFVAIYTKSKNLKATTIIEHSVWSSVCKTGFLHGIPIWSYGDQVLFETERPEAHFREALSTYSDSLQKVLCLLDMPIGQNIIEKALEGNVEMIEEHEIEALTNYGQWRDSNLASIKKAKTVLEEREETIDAFIVCKKCKSNAVDTEQKQTRSADEPMTIFCMCRRCGSRWRIE
jgi:DNA-directed RNA polymerase subunit M/transcription elongation factor TFIIS